MADLGNLLGSLMAGVIRARRVADEETAALAEYYRGNPLLQGLSVPRIRIPELTIDIPCLIEDDVAGKAGAMEAPPKIAAAVNARLLSSLAERNIKFTPAFHKIFAREVKNQMA